MTPGALRCATARSRSDDGGGSVVLDDGTAIGYDAAVLAASPFRSLRAGQRVVVRVDDPGRPTVVLGLGAVAAPPA